MANTFKEIKDKVYTLILQRSTSTTYNEDRVGVKVNDIIKQICRGKVKNIIDPRIGSYKAGDLSFLKRKQAITGVKTVSLTADTTVGATSLSLDASDLSSSGAVIILDNIITYTGKTSTSITGCTGILFAFKQGTGVRQLYSLPSEAYKPYRLFWLRDDSPSNKLEIPFTNPRDEREYNYYYSLVQEEDGNTKYTDIIGFNQSEKFFLYYRKTIDTLVNDTDETILPDEYGVEVVAPIVAGEILRETKEDVRGQKFLNQGYGKLIEMFDRYTKEINEYSPKVKRKKPSLSSIRGNYRGNNRNCG